MYVRALQPIDCTKLDKNFFIQFSAVDLMRLLNLCITEMLVVSYDQGLPIRVLTAPSLLTVDDYF